MDLQPSEEQLLLRNMVGRFLADRCATDGLGRGPMAREEWRALGELGLFTFLLPESGGGMNGRAQDTMIVAEELGRALAITPLAECVLVAADLVARHGTSAQIERWVRPVREGEALLAWASGEAELRGGLLVGRCPLVRWGADADGFAVLVRDALHIVARDAANLTLRPIRLADGTPAATVDLAGCKSEAITLPEGELDRSLAVAQLAYVAEMVGAMDLLLGQTADYVQQRVQFGVAVASFQTVQHRVARMFVALEQARSLLIKAAVADRGDPGFERGVLAAKAYVAEAAQRLAEDAVQLHGGMGVTEELPIGRGLRRVIVLARLFGGADTARARLAA